MIRSPGPPAEASSAGGAPPSRIAIPERVLVSSRGLAPRWRSASLRRDRGGDRRRCGVRAGRTGDVRLPGRGGRVRADRAAGRARRGARGARGDVRRRVGGGRGGADLRAAATTAGSRSTRSPGQLVALWPLSLLRRPSARSRRCRSARRLPRVSRLRHRQARARSRWAERHFYGRSRRGVRRSRRGRVARASSWRARCSREPRDEGRSADDRRRALARRDRRFEQGVPVRPAALARHRDALPRIGARRARRHDRRVPSRGRALRHRAGVGRARADARRPHLAVARGGVRARDAARRGRARRDPRVLRRGGPRDDREQREPGVVPRRRRGARESDRHRAGVHAGCEETRSSSACPACRAR